MVAVEPRKQHKGFNFLSDSKVVKGKHKILVRSSLIKTAQPFVSVKTNQILIIHIIYDQCLISFSRTT